MWRAYRRRELLGREELDEEEDDDTLGEDDELGEEELDDEVVAERFLAVLPNPPVFFVADLSAFAFVVVLPPLAAARLFAALRFAAARLARFVDAIVAQP